MNDLIKPVTPVTTEVVDLVDRYVRKALQDASTYVNSDPLDESGVYSLHLLAADIYALGFADGDRVSCLRFHGEDMRKNLRAREQP